MNILLAEDDSNISLIAKVALERMGGHKVTVAENGVLALELANTQSFDLILLDSMMPEKDGLATCIELKKNPKTQGTPIIFLSARSNENDIQQGLSAGAIGYISKPFEPTQICAVIKELLASNGVAA
ncbi:MAG: response regulator [Bdellovibrionales bacterium]|nr:response regulator [Bdellovibrionales bacterium]